MHTELDKKRNTYMKMENDTSKSHHDYEQLVNRKGANFVKMYMVCVGEHLFAELMKMFFFQIHVTEYENFFQLFV